MLNNKAAFRTLIYVIITHFVNIYLFFLYILTLEILCFYLVLLKLMKNEETIKTDMIYIDETLKSNNISYSAMKLTIINIYIFNKTI